MFSFNELTIGGLDNAYEKNGSALTPINNEGDLVNHKSKAKGKSKVNLPVISSYRGVRGTYTPSNVYFVDIDTKRDVEIIFSNPSKLFATLPNICFIQKSASGKLHICGMFAGLADTEEEWSNQTRLYTAATLYAIKKTYNIDYRTDLDSHSFGYWQLLYMSDYDVVFNNFLTPIRISRADADRLFNEYNEFRPVKKTITSSSSGDILGKFEYGNSNTRVCIDRNFKIGCWSGNDIRWRISKIAVEIFGNTAKEWCDMFFYYGNNRSIYSNTRDGIGINHLVLDWLVKNGYLLVKIKEEKEQTETNYEEIDMSSDYLSDYVEEIVKKINEENVLTIYAPTGAGKTTAISGCESGGKKKICKGLVDYFPNSVVLVPFNVTNNLYASLNIISSSNENVYNPGKPNVMIWDQFNRIANEITPDIVFVDESHTLFLDRTYRDAACETIKTLYTYLQRNIKIVFISATPAGEVKIFNSYVMKFNKKDKRNVKIDLCFVNDTFTCILKDIRRGGFDKYCVFSDRDARLLYANIINAGVVDSVIYHSLYPKNLQQLREEEKINSRISFLTCIAFNGLNIRNSNENILIDIRVTPGETSYNEIIQIIGRFRNNKNITVRLYVDNKYSENVNLQEMFDDAKVICESESAEVNSEYWERMNNSDVQDALKQIEAFYASQDIHTITGLLKKLYPINIVNAYAKEIDQRRNPSKKQASDLFREARANVSKPRAVSEKEMVNEFLNEWYKRIDYLTGNGYDIWNLVDDLISKSKVRGTLVSTIIDKVERIINISSFTDEMWNEEVKKRTMILDGVKSIKLKKSLIKRFADNDKIRSKYKNLSIDTIINYELEDMDEIFKTTIANRVEAGSKSKTNHKKQICCDDVVYNSIKEASDALGVSDVTIHKRLKSGMYKYVTH